MALRILRSWRLVVAGVLLAAATVAFRSWRTSSRNGGQKPAEPFRIAGSFYYVGASDVASFLITTPNGHILLDGGYPGTAPMIAASIRKLGFDIRDVKFLINSEPHFDHAGGLAELQRASGAQLWASEASADAIEAGGDDPYAFLPYRMLIWVGLIRYERARVTHRFVDGATLRVGNTVLTAHITGGHSSGCTTWTFPVIDGERVLNVVSACSLALLPGMRFVDPQRYPGIRGDFERTISVLRTLPADIWVTSHARLFGRYRKFSAQRTARSPADPFIDRAGYMAYLDSGEARFKRAVDEQRRAR